MTIEETLIPGVKILTPRVFNDARGYFTETWVEAAFNEIAGEPIHFVQDNQSQSARGVVRGLHFQSPPHAQAKLVRCLSGRVLDIAVDIRKGSPVFGKYVAVELTGDNFRQLFLPRGIAHGFAVLSDEAVFAYKCDNYYAPDHEGGLDLFDRDLNISWPVKPHEAILSEKDRRYPKFKNFDSPFTFEKKQ